MHIWKSVSLRGNGKCKGPEAGESLTGLRNCKEASDTSTGRSNMGATRHVWLLSP